MTDLYRAQWLFRDSETKLVIPNLKIIGINAITNIVSSYVTSPSKKIGRFWAEEADYFGTGTDGIDDIGIEILSSVINLATIGLGVTKIQTSQEYVMPFSKGIGSTGEVIHLIGARNEIINLEFTTEKYPGRLAYVLRGILQYILEEAQVVYLIDDLFLATPCLVKKTKLNKEGLYRGAVMGELELVSLTTGGSFYDSYTGSKNKVRSTVKKFKKSMNSGEQGFVGQRRIFGNVLGIGSITILSAMIWGINASGGNP